jgi:mono/diheme cytochrome c family protein
MNRCNPISRAAIVIAVTLPLLAGCGAGSPGAGSQPAPVPAAQAIPQAPGIPAGLSATGGTNKVALLWSAVSGATSYNIYWSTTPEINVKSATKVATAGNSYIHRALPAAASYYYLVTAQNNSGESSAAGTVSATTSTLDGTVPYTTYCAGCHGYLAVSTVTNAGAPQIRSALQQINPMSALTLDDSQINAISAALSNSN